MNLKRRASKGVQIIHLTGLIFISLMISALSIDFSYYFAAQNRLQTAADAAALAAAMQLYRSTSHDSNRKVSEAINAAKDFVDENEPGLKLAIDDVTFGYINPITKRYDPYSFTSFSIHPDFASTGGYNAVRVKIFRAKNKTNAPLRSMMANLFGVSSMDTAAHSVALIDKNITSINNGGLRPIYACEAQVQKALKDGVLENNTIRVYSDHLEIDGEWDIENCPPRDSGHWGFSDFSNNGGSLGLNGIGSWFDQGYPGTVALGNDYSTQSDNFLDSVSPQLDTLISQETVFPIPIYSQWGGGRSTNHVNITGFVGFQLTDFKNNGRYQYLEGHFERYICNKGCASNGNETASAGSSVVKIRLAAQS